MSLLDDQIEAAERAQRAFQVLGRRLARRGRPTATVVDLAMGMELVLKNLRFQKAHEASFRHLARRIIEAEQDAAAHNVLAAFPDAVIEIDIEGLEQLA